MNYQAMKGANRRVHLAAGNLRHHAASRDASATAHSGIARRLCQPTRSQPQHRDRRRHAAARRALTQDLCYQEGGRWLM